MSCLCNKSKYLYNWFLNLQKFLFYFKVRKLEVSSHIVLERSSEHLLCVSHCLDFGGQDVEKGMLKGAFRLLLTSFAEDV